MIIIGLLLLSTLSIIAPQVKASPGVPPEVVCVPFHGQLAAVPHDTWIGRETILKGTAHDKDGDGTMTACKWDFGDGYSTDWISGVNPYIIEAKHTYTGTMADGTPYSAGKYFTAWLYVKDNEGLEGKDSYFIAIRDKTLDVEVNVAIDNGLWWLHKQQVRGNYPDGAEYGYWNSPYGYYVASTSACTEAFELQGHSPNGDLGEDPYVETVQRGLNYLFNQFHSYSVYQDPTYCPFGNPDADGNGIGLGCYGPNEYLYESGMALMTISSTGTPNKIATTGSANVVGRAYKDIVQDMIDWFAWAQSDPVSGIYEGGWRYQANYEQSDNSVSQWPVIGMEAAERNFGSAVTIPSFVRPELAKWLSYSQNTNGGFGYADPSNWVNTAKTGAGCAMLSWIGAPTTDAKFQSALGFLDADWYDTASSYTNFGDYYTMYAIMKGMRIPNPNVVFIGSHDWYAEYARYIVDEQNNYGGEYIVDHSWLAGYLSEAHATAWALATLTLTVTTPGPVAEAGSNVDNFPPTIPVKFDASGSYHRDPTKSIVLYGWDFESDGTWDYSGTDAKVEHAYPAYTNPDGSIDWSKTTKDYAVTLRVTDNNDPPLHDTDTCVVHITAPPWKPVADPDGPYEGSVGIPIQLDGSKSYDPESKMYPLGHPWYETIAKYEWDLNNDGKFDDSMDVKPSYTWNTVGAYSVGLKVTDSQPSGSGGTIGPLDVDIKHTTVVIKKPEFNVAVVFTEFSDDDPAPSRSLTEFQSIKEDLNSYYHEVSYGSISFDTKFYPNDGSWLRLSRDRKYYGKDAEQFVKDAIDTSDAIVDFTRYDYDADNGRGIAILIHAGHSEQEGKSTDDLSTQVMYGGVFSASGGYPTKDNTKVDAIIAAETDNVGGWAHEVGHVLGKLLVTSVTGTSKDGAWYLPDRYKGGYFAGNGEIDYWGLMGKGSWLPLDWLGRGTDGTHPDHMCSYSKEWLGWLKYREYQHPSYGTYWINSLVTMKYGDDVFKYKINDNMYYILEVRNKNSEYSKWDTTAPIQRPAWPVLTYDSAEVIYKVEKKNNMWIVNVVSHIVLFPLQDYHSDNANEVLFTVVDENWGTKYEMKTEIKKPSIWKKIGAVLNPRAQLLSSIPQVIHGMPFQFEYPLPDLDLHAYSDDGKHVGMNYTTGEYEIQIPEATASGDLWNGQEWIFVPEDVNVHFVANAKDNKDFFDAFPEAWEISDGVETFDLGLVYYDSDGNRWESTPITEQINPGETIWHIPTITENPDGTYTTGLTSITWEYIYEDSTRGTVLKISTDDKHFQFISPDKEFLVKHDPRMRITKRAIVINYKDWEIRIVTVAVDTKLDFCVAVAWDLQTRKQYFLMDKPGIER